jgi:hypothetical protein
MGCASGLFPAIGFQIINGATRLKIHQIVEASTATVIMVIITQIASSANKRILSVKFGGGPIHWPPVFQSEAKTMRRWRLTCGRILGVPPLPERSLAGVRPSPGAATSARSGGLELSSAPDGSEPAAPGDAALYTRLVAHWLRCRFPLLLWRRRAERGGRRSPAARHINWCGNPLECRHEPQYREWASSPPTLSSKGGEGEPPARCSPPPDACNVQRGRAHPRWDHDDALLTCSWRLSSSTGSLCVWDPSSCRRASRC